MALLFVFFNIFFYIFEINNLYKKLNYEEKNN